MFVVALVLALVIAGSVLFKGVSKPEAGPDSPEYLDFRRRLRRNMMIAVALMVASIVLNIVDGIGATSATDSFLGLPDWAGDALALLVNPGAYMLPLAALSITELTSPKPAKRIATLTPRSVRTLAPTWLVWSVGVVAGLAVLSTLFVAVPTIRDAREFHAPRVDVNYGGGADIWLQIIYVVVAALLAAVTVRAAVRRPDLDPRTDSDKWSRSGVVIRALGLMLVASLAAIGAVANEVSTAAWAYVTYLDGGGTAVDGYRWLVNFPVKTTSTWVMNLSYLGVLGALGMFAFPPKLREDDPVMVAR